LRKRRRKCPPNLYGEPQSRDFTIKIAGEYKIQRRF